MKARQFHSGIHPDCSPSAVQYQKPASQFPSTSAFDVPSVNRVNPNFLKQNLRFLGLRWHRRRAALRKDPRRLRMRCHAVPLLPARGRTRQNPWARHSGCVPCKTAWHPPRIPLAIQRASRAPSLVTAASPSARRQLVDRPRHQLAIAEATLSTQRTLPRSSSRAYFARSALWRACSRV